jgi:hypothetical protein
MKSVHPSVLVEVLDDPRDDRTIWNKSPSDGSLLEGPFVSDLSTLPAQGEDHDIQLVPPSMARPQLGELRIDVYCLAR